MQLIGMLDSPYVRRTAISLRLLGVPFEHRPLSVFRTYAEFASINPIVKAPSFVCDDGEVLMDSTLIIDYAEALAAPRSLMPKSVADRQHALRVIGLALAACEKSVQIVYERNLRPPEKQHEPWLSRICGQTRAAYAELEKEIVRNPLDASSAGISQSGVTVAVVWQFTQAMLADVVPAADHPALHAHSRVAEALPEFIAFPPDGPGAPAVK